MNDIGFLRCFHLDEGAEYPYSVLNFRVVYFSLAIACEEIGLASMVGLGLQISTCFGTILIYIGFFLEFGRLMNI